nr:retrovirus-related Pol polyprotein from transposon TNT 1-94 [Tanacetum cinerariifolium]
MFKLNLAPLAPKILNNREHVDILHEIVKHARALRPLDSDLDSACKIVQQIQEVLVYVKDTCPSLTKPSEKLVAVTPLNKNKKVRFVEAVTSSSNTKKQADSYKTQDANKHVLTFIGMKSSTSASRSRPSGNTKNNRILQTTNSSMKNKVEDHPRSVKSKSNKTYHVIEHVCNVNVKHTMLNTNSELIYVKCNQSLFDANHDVCLLEFVDDVNVRSKFKSAKKIKNKNIWKPTSKVFTNIRYMWKATGRNFTIVGNTCRLTRITSTKVATLKETTSKSVTTENPQIKVDSRRPKITKFVGLCHNLFSIGGFCDSDLEVAFRHTCYIRDLEGVDLLKGSRGSNLYTLSLEEMFSSLPICLLSKALKTKSWLWNRSEDLGKLKPKADIGIFVNYAPTKKAFRIYNKRTRLIIETIHVTFDELTIMASEQFSSGHGPWLGSNTIYKYN